MSLYIEDPPSGTIDGTNTVFTIHRAPSTIFGEPSCEVYLNGLLQEPEGGDYTISGLTITYVLPPQVGDTMTTWVFQT